VILLSCLGLGLDFIFMALAPSLGWLLVGRVISAITSASFTTANAYIADVTPPDRRAQAYGMIGAAYRAGLHRRPGARRLAGRHRPALAVLGGGFPGAVQLRLRLVPAARIAGAGHAHVALDWAHANPLGSLVLLSAIHRCSDWRQSCC
jgi:DHA1 family tetracycline resistance protein-like MFS transporter